MRWFDGRTAIEAPKEMEGYCGQLGGFGLMAKMGKPTGKSPEPI